MRIVVEFYTWRGIKRSISDNKKRSIQKALNPNICKNSIELTSGKLYNHNTSGNANWSCIRRIKECCF